LSGPALLFNLKPPSRPTELNTKFLPLEVSKTRQQAPAAFPTVVIPSTVVTLSDEALRSQVDGSESGASPPTEVFQESLDRPPNHRPFVELHVGLLKLTRLGRAYPPETPMSSPDRIFTIDTTA